MIQCYVLLFALAPIPREPLPREKTFQFVDINGEINDGQRLPCWQDHFGARKEDAQKEGESLGNDIAIEEPEVYMSLVVPAYNEEERLEIMLTEAVEYLQKEYGNQRSKSELNGNRKKPRGSANGHATKTSTAANSPIEPSGWEILIISDGSTDRTVGTALKFASRMGKDSSLIRVVSLGENRGKGGAVTHGMRHVRGKYAVFADADGASKFEDLGKLVHASVEIEDANGRGVAVGSRAHLVGSEAVVKVRLLETRSQCTLLTAAAAIISTQFSDALIPSTASAVNATRNCLDQRYTVRLQTLFTAVIAIHHPVHALRRLDLRCRDADVGRARWYTCR